MRAASGVVSVPPGAWEKWVCGLATGDEVVVARKGSNEAIYLTTVRVTKTGRVTIPPGRQDWSRGFVSTPGGGSRFIASPDWIARAS